MSITPNSVEATANEDADYITSLLADAPTDCEQPQSNGSDTEFTPSADGLPGTALTERHRAYLAKSGISTDYLDQEHVSDTVRSVTTFNELPEALRWNVDADAATGILFGYRDPKTSTVTWQFRADTPRNADVKYLFAKGVGSPVGLVSAPLDTATVGHTVLIVEGTKQSLAVASAVAHDPTAVVVSIAGCHGGMRNGNLHPGIQHVIRGAKRIVCVFDADAANNPKVYDAADTLGKAIRARMSGKRRIVAYAQVASLTGGTTAGVDDVLAEIPVLERAACITTLLDDAIPTPSDIRPSYDTRRKRDDQDGEDAHRFYHPFAGGLRTKACADDICVNLHLGIDEENKVIHRYDADTGLYVPDGSAGSMRGSEIIKNELFERLGDDYRSSYVSSVEEAVRARLSAEGRVFTDQPDTDGLLPVRNGLLDMETGRLIPYTPDRFIVAKLDVDYDPDATCSEFDAWLPEATRLPSGADQAAIVLDTLTTLLDTASGIRRPDRALYLIGPPRAGKGTLGNDVIAALVAKAHRTTMSLADMAKDRPFDNAKLYQKLLNISGETADEYISDTSIMKRVFGGDLITGELKFGKSWDFYNRAATIFMGNDIPHVDDTSGAFGARLTPVVFTSSNVGKEDRGIGKRLSDERSGILNRLLDAWRERHLNRNSAYLEPAAEAMEAFTAATNPVAAYINEHIDIAPQEAFSGTRTVDPAYATTRMDLYSHYANVTRASGGKPRKREKFERDIARAPFNINTDAITPKSDGNRKVIACRIRPVEVSNSIGMSTQHGVTVAIPASTLAAETNAKNTRATTDEDTEGDDPFTGGSTVEPEPEPTPPTPPSAATGNDDVPSPRDNPALARCGDMFWKLVTERGKPVELNRTGFEKLAVQRTVNSTPASVTITELSEALNLTPEYARGYLRAVHQKLADAGVTLLERRLAKPNMLGAEEPLTGEFVKKPEKAELKHTATEAKKKVTAAAAEVRTAAKTVRAAERALAQAEKRKVSPEELETHQMTLQSANTALSEAEDKLTAANQTAERTRDLAANGDYLQFERMAYVVLLNPNDFPTTITKDN